MAIPKTYFFAASGNEAPLSGHHRMIERPEDGGDTPEAIMAAHRERTVKRMRGSETVLLIQTGTDLNFATNYDCSGLGAVPRGKGSAGTFNVHMRSTFAVDGNGLPLGVLQIDDGLFDGKPDRDKPAEESARWLPGWWDASELAARVPEARAISVMDRESDIAVLFAEQQAVGGADLLVRAKSDRALPDAESLFVRLRQAPANGEHEVRIDRASPRRSALNARWARSELRWQVLEVLVPRKEHGQLGTRSMRMTALHALEPEPPPGVKKVDWLLLTTLPVADRKAAGEILDLYALRRRIEDWHRILKAGCEAEDHAYESVERIHRAVTLNALIAWRLSVLTLLGRTAPDLSAAELFAGSEIGMLLDYARHMGFALSCQAGSDVPPDLDAVSLAEVMLLMARLGGYLNRKQDAAPGNKVLWDGYSRMSAGAQAVERMVRLGQMSAVHSLRASLKNK